MPNLFEEWENDTINAGEEEKPGTEIVHPSTGLQTPEMSPFVVDLTADANQIGVLLPPEVHRDADEKIIPYHDPPQSRSDAASPPAPSEPAQPITDSVERLPQSAGVPTAIPVPDPAELTATEPGTPIPDPVTPISQPPPSQDITPEPIQPAPAALETKDPSIVQGPDIKTNIRVHIGRIEVQLPQPSKTPSPRTAPPAKARTPFRPPMSLQNYLEKRRR